MKMNATFCTFTKNELDINLLTKGQIDLSHVDSEKPQNSTITQYLIKMYEVHS